MKNLDLQSAARTVELPPGDVDAVMTRGATLANRRRRVVAGGLAVAVLSVSAGIYARLNETTPVPVTAGDTTAKRGDVGIRWEKVNPSSGLSFTTTMTPDSLYAVSTGPGRGAVSEKRRVVWHSDDGVDWSEVSDLGSDLYLANLADRGTRLYGVGTGAASAAVGGSKPVAPLVVGTSDDGGRTWSKQGLPIDLAAISAKARNVGTYAVDIATTKDAVVAVVGLMADLDVPKLLPAGQTAPHGWAITDTGVDVLGDGPACPAGMSLTPPGEQEKPRPSDQQDPARQHYREWCFDSAGRSTEVRPQETRGVTASYTWAQLGVDGDLLRAVQQEPIVFRAADGSTFERITSAEVAIVDGPGLLERDGDGLLLVGQKGGVDRSGTPVESVILRSVDGRTWTRAASPPGLSYALAVGRLQDRTALMGEAPSGPMLWVSDGAGGWSSTSLASAVEPSIVENANLGLVAAAIGPLGVVAVVNAMHDSIAEAGGVEVKQDGYTLKIVNDRWAAVVTDSTGKEVGRADSLMGGRGGETGPLRQTGSGGVVLVDPATGAERVTFSSRAVRDAMGKGLRNVRFEPKFRVVASRDGLTWADVSLDELAGTSITNVFRVLMTGERAVIAASSPAKNKDDIPPQIAVVGTPR